jgi:hypothetical protein
MKRLTPVVLMLAIVVAAVRAGDTSEQATTVDLTPAIKIGDFTVSRYLFEKAYQQFATSITRLSGQKPSSKKAEDWFRLYLAQQVIKADLVAQKQLDRPEVVEITGRMARHMLVQPRGLLYRELGGTDPIAFRRERRAVILKECHFSVLPGNIARLWTAIAPSFSRGTPPLEADVAPIASSIVASFAFDGVPKQISALDFVRDFQQGIARMAPRDTDDLRQQIEDIAVAEYDLAEAKRRRLDQTPQFLEDHRNFALNQALVLHEKEVLSKQAVISPGELESYYFANRERYASPIEITGVLYLFSNSEQARRGLVSMESEAFSVLRSEDVIDPFVVQREGFSAFLKIPYTLFVSMPTGKRYGPLPYQGKYAVFVKRSAGEVTPLPFETIRSEIQAKLVREKITACELDYLDRNIARVKIYLDLTNYGLQKSTFVGVKNQAG